MVLIFNDANLYVRFVYLVQHEVSVRLEGVSCGVSALSIGWFPLLAVHPGHTSPYFTAHTFSLALRFTDFPNSAHAYQLCLKNLKNAYRLMLLSICTTKYTCLVLTPE